MGAGDEVMQQEVAEDQVEPLLPKRVQELGGRSEDQALAVMGSVLRKLILGVVDDLPWQLG